MAMVIHRIPYSRKFHGIKLHQAHRASYLIFKGLNFRQCSKVCHIRYAFYNTGEKDSRIKLSLMRAGWRNWQNFSPTVESCKYAPLFCMLASGKTGEGAYAQDHDISA